jgi:GNAT superfamily N-acetyltransferase
MLMRSLPRHEIVVYHNADTLPQEAQEMFAAQLADSRRPLPEDRWDRDQWCFALTCAVTSDGHVLGGVHLDIGPIGGEGPLAKRKLAYLERTPVRPEYRRCGLATRLLREAMRAGREAGCLYIRCSNDWDNEAERRLFLKCGFALVDLNGETDQEPCYFAVRPLQRVEEL